MADEKKYEINLTLDPTPEAPAAPDPTLPPARATAAFSEKDAGFRWRDISVVVASASILSTSSKVVMLSRKFSFVSPFRFLYCLVVIPDHAREISSVRIAYSMPFSTPRRSHSSVSSFLTCMV